MSSIEINLEEEFSLMEKKVASMPPIKTTVKLIIGGSLFFIDGTGENNIISNNNEIATCTIKLSEIVFIDLKSKKYDSVTALFAGKIDIDGNYGVAFKMRKLLE